MDSIDKALLFAQLDRIISIVDMEENKENALDEIVRELKKLSRYVEDYAI